MWLNVEKRERLIERCFFINSCHDHWVMENNLDEENIQTEPSRFV